MADAFSTNPAGLPAQSGDTQPESQDTGTNATETTPKPRENLHDDPRFRAMQSEMQAREAAANRRAAEAERVARLAQAREKSLTEVVSQFGDGTSAEAIARAAKMAEALTKAEAYDELVAELAAKEEAENYKVRVYAWAAESGLDVNDPEFQQAFEYASRTGDTAPLNAIPIAREMARRMQQQSPSSPTGETPPSPALPTSTPPPAGRTIRPNTERLEAVSAELGELLSEPTKNAARIKTLKAERDQLLS